MSDFLAATCAKTANTSGIGGTRLNQHYFKTMGLNMIYTPNVVYPGEWILFGQSESSKKFVAKVNILRVCIPKFYYFLKPTNTLRKP